ncbi:MAG: hypothetical protein LBJ21_05930 [Acidobacteriota bacterium]|nr:hypothetical protein [Acidobacteriota bacterium]
MEAMRQIVEGSLLNQVITLPKSLQNVLVEVIVKPVVDEAKPDKLNRSMLRSQLQGSHTESLSGILPTSIGMTIEDLREERRMKYERVD